MVQVIVFCGSFAMSMSFFLTYCTFNTYIILAIILLLTMLGYVLKKLTLFTRHEFSMSNYYLSSQPGQKLQSVFDPMSS